MVLVRLAAHREFVKYTPFIRQLFHKKATAWTLYKRNKNDQLNAGYIPPKRSFFAVVDQFNAAKENELYKTGNLGSFYSYANC